ncbi:MAG TPA: hypothetical protein VMW17_21195 [Candidatus Binatia bacterium]|nr:hypothetical protein [Candidatus Binatia bacterium]
MKRNILAIAYAVPALLTAACTHTMQVNNIRQYVKQATAPSKLTLTLEDRSLSPEEHEYFTFVGEALATHPSVAKVVVTGIDAPSDPTSSDFVLKVRPETHYEGSSWNYLITFPGFLLFTHAWNGFVYRAEVKTDIELSKPGAVDPQTREITTSYDLRHCSFMRGCLVSSGWYTPGYGGLNLIIGFFMVGYDARATPDFQQAIRSAYGEFIANSIIEMTAGPPPGAAARNATIDARFDPSTLAFHVDSGL